MGTYYRYVNYTREEFVSLSDLRDGGNKENAALYCAPALAWLLIWPHVCGDGYRGRWAPKIISARKFGSIDRKEQADDVRIVTDAVYDFPDMEDAGFLNITPGLLQSMRTQIPSFVQDYQPRVHDLQLVQRVQRPVASYELANPVSATCKCGWKTGPIYGKNREHMLELAVASHVNE